MVFSSFLFIFGFLPIFLLVYFLVPRKGKNIWVLLASYFFYAWGAPKVVPILLVSSAFDYLIVSRMSLAESKLRRRYCVVGVVLNLILLGYYKYANFFIEQASIFGVDSGDWVRIVLPIGISFFTFQKISYVVDVYRRVSKPASSLLDYLLYVVLFPQLIAGPILRYHDVESQIRKRTHSMELFVYGSIRFMCGLSKKVLLANEMGAVADNVFSLGAEGLDSSYAWLGAICYAFQIYFDFSGYSDMAIGLCAMIGFQISENFNLPYSSASITEFWRRWHISLSNWMKEYLYIPLGGNRSGIVRTAVNLWLVFLLSGFWHGAGWTFIAWGALHGLFLSIERLTKGITKVSLPRVLRIFYVWLVVLVSWVLFRSESFADAWQFLQVQFSFVDAVNPPAMGFVMHERGRFVFLLCCLMILASLIPKARQWVESEYSYPMRRPAFVFSFAYLGFLVSVITLATTAFNPFIYFRF